MTIMDRSVLARRGEVNCKKILMAINTTFLPFTLAFVAMGLVIKFGTFVLKDNIQSVFDDLMVHLNMEDEPEIDIGSYDLETIVSDLGIWFISIGLGSSVMAVLGVAAGKTDVHYISLIYCALLGVTMFSKIGLVLVLSIRRELGCYDKVWSVIVDHKIYLVMAGSLLFAIQFMLFVSAIVHTKAVCRRSSERKTDSTNVLKAEKRFNRNKSIADLISSTTGILSQTSSPDASQDVRNLIEQSLAGNLFASTNFNGGTNRNQPFMPFMSNFGHPPMSPLSQLLNQYCMQGRFSNHVDPYNPLNIFSTAFFNPYTNGRGVAAENQRLDDICGLFQQQNTPGNQMVVPFLNRFPRFERLDSQFSIQGVPVVVHGSPDSLRRDDARVCELYQNDADYGKDTRERTSSYHSSRDRINSHKVNRDRTDSLTAKQDRTSRHISTD